MSRTPIHPGAILADELEKLGLSAAEIARLIDVPANRISRIIDKVLERPGIGGPQASPKGLRHGFAVQADSNSVPLNMVQKWLGPRQTLPTTAIYADAISAEENSVEPDVGLTSHLNLRLQKTKHGRLSLGAMRIIFS